MTDSPERAGADPAPLRPAVPAAGLDTTREFPPAVDPPTAAGADLPTDPATDDRPTAPIAAVAMIPGATRPPATETDLATARATASVATPPDAATGELPEVTRHRRPLPRLLRLLGGIPVRTFRAVRAWAQRPTGRLVLPAGLTTLLLLASVAGGALLVPAAGSGEAAPTPPPPPPPTPPPPPKTGEGGGGPPPPPRIRRCRAWCPRSPPWG